MADQVNGVVITPNADGQTYSVQIGPNGFQGLQLSALFDRTTFDESHLFANIRLKKLIGNYGALSSQEFKDALNANGIRTTAGDFFGVGFTTNPDGSVTVAFATERGAAPNQTITVNPNDLEDDSHDLTVILLNIGTFLRVAGFHDLTTPAASGYFTGKTAIQAVTLQTFWY